MSERFRRARELSWDRFGKAIVFFLPGGFRLDGVSGKYPALSVTGPRCSLQCDHCRGKILQSMVPAESPEKLVAKCLELARKGHRGVLVSGGCDPRGRLPWKRFAPAIARIKSETDLFVSVHCGILDEEDALGLKEAGTDQALLDVLGDDDAYRRVCHVPFGVEGIVRSMELLRKVRLPVVPHVVCGMDRGRVKGEYRALELVASFQVRQVVIVSLMSLRGTPMEKAPSPSAEAVADVIAEARLLMPDALVALGCARRRGDVRMETAAIDAGVNRLALPSDEAVEHAKAYGLDIRYQKTCCSVWRDWSSASSW